MPSNGARFHGAQLDTQPLSRSLVSGAKQLVVQDALET